MFLDCVIVDASSMMNESFENSENIVNIKIQGSESDSVKQFKVLKVNQGILVYLIFLL